MVRHFSADGKTVNIWRATFPATYRDTKDYSLNDDLAQRNLIEFVNSESRKQYRDRCSFQLER